ncbi:MAG TPA: D-glycerate dehydrogenase [Deltaproteobacteria bacterium]|nr:MAG: D-glycerate dehydrogenase [Deltaproteobacteria bacterium GWC2_65_14]HBO70177.1 D-glycerate dehydrogenase [Deltaproteobacteria bacterium]
MADRPRVVITRRLPGVSPVRIGEAASAVWPDGDGPMPREELLRLVPGAAGILCTLADRIDASLMDAAGGGLRVISTFAVGVNNIDIPEATRRGIRVCNTPGVLTEATADLAFGLLLAAARRFPDSERFLREGKFTGWDPWGFLGVPVFRRTLGIVGMGKIGSAVALRARGFEMRVLYHNRNRLPSVREKELRAEHFPLEELLAESDFVLLSVPLTEKTRGMIGRERLLRMKKEAVLVNVARGEVVDEAALALALSEGRIFGAGLDVYEKEPEVHPGLLSAPGAVLLPHLGSATRETRERMGRLAAENLLAVLAGSEPPGPVN